ncbi:MAG: hypothetical protein Q9220_002920 [cf. Caloplaca sp. 1 TL-2023]
MDKAIVQATHSLVPELNDPLPAELINLAVSLLAQSRNNASSLKAEEEIARTYACTHLACERLKQSLGLSRIQPRPPCPPKIYQKLYRHLDSALPAGTRRTSRVPRPSEITAPRQPSPITPRKPNRSAATAPFSARAKRKRATTVSGNVPSWVMPAIRGLCKRLGAPAAPPHVFAGVSSVLTLPSPVEPTSDDDQIERLRRLSVDALIVSIYILVRTRLSGIETDPKAYPAQRDEALAILTQLHNSDQPLAGDLQDQANDWMREIGKGRWTDLDWFANVVQGAGLGLGKDNPNQNGEPDDSGVDEDDELIDTTGAFTQDLTETDFLQPGLGTMMQDRVDYLSAKKRAEYRVWKKDLLARIDRMEKAQAP